MADTNTTLGSRNNFIPGVNVIGWGNLINRFLRSASNLNVTKFSALPWVPHGTYLGGWNGDVSSKSSSFFNLSKTGLSGGFRRLPILSGANDSFFRSKTDIVAAGLPSFPFGNYRFADMFKNTVLVSDPANEGTEFKYNKKSKEYADSIFSLESLPTTGIDYNFNIYNNEEDYLVFDLSKTMIIPINPQYILHPTQQNRGYMSFHKVCELSDTDRSVSKLYSRGFGPSSGTLPINIPFLSTIELGALFCVEYLWELDRSSGDDLSAQSSVPKTGRNVHVNPGVAHVIYIEFDSTINFSDSDDESTSLNQITEA